MTSAAVLSGSSQPKTRGAHIPELDGIRGLAILMVLAFHFGGILSLPAPLVVPLRLGWSGVNLFFVLSGALITGILIDTRRAPNYFSSFYVRRCLRILPLYFLAVFLYFQVALPIAHHYGHWQTWSTELEPWYWSHLSNWQLAFDRNVPLLTHFWSLAIEEQFYLCWPLVVFLVRPSRLPHVTIGILLSSFVLRYGLQNNDFGPEFLYRLTPMRLESLAWGALIAIGVRNERYVFRLKKLVWPLALISALVLLAVVVKEKPSGLHGKSLMDTFGFSALDIISAALVFTAVTTTGASSWLTRRLRGAFLGLFGKYSYGLYVVHFPIAYGVATVASKVSGNLQFPARCAAVLLGVGLSLAIASLSWHFFEQPFLKLKDRFAVRLSPAVQEASNAEENSTTPPVRIPDNLLGRIRMAMFARRIGRGPTIACITVAAALLVLLSGELLLSVRQQSQTSDEGVHLLSGYRYWTNRDFTVNPEHPPLVKMVAAIPLLFTHLQQPDPRTTSSKLADFEGGSQLLYRNDPDALLWRARAAASIFTVLLALLVFCCAGEMGGWGVALIALGVLVLEPNLLAHGALITTDLGESCFLFASVYALYRYAKRPTKLRLLVCGCAVALALASKHSGILVVPILILLGLADVLIHRGKDGYGRIFRLRILHNLIAVAAIVAIGCAGLWAFYGFRFHASPGGPPLNPSLRDFAQSLPSRTEARVISGLARTHLLPEAYLYGLTDVLEGATGRPVFFLGKVYATGRRLYFPSVLLIKCTLSFLLLLALVPFAGLFSDRVRQRAWLFLILPAVLFFFVAVNSKMNLGVRHILPVFPFLIVMGALAAGKLARRSVVGCAVVAVLLLIHAFSSLRTFPNYLTYSNEIAGGPAKTYRLLSDSNNDWGQGLKQAQSYIASHQITDCWLAYSLPEVDLKHYQIPCRLLPSGVGHLAGLSTPLQPPAIDGTVLIAASEAAGHTWGPGEMNPYRFFLDRQPTAYIGNTILVFEGHFDLPLASAVTRAGLSRELERDGRWNEAIEAAEVAVNLAPQSADMQAGLCIAMAAAGRQKEAQGVCRAAATIARRIYPDYQFRWIPNIRSLGGILQEQESWQ